jgi:hypothetical protein
MIKKENQGWTVEGSALPPAKKTVGQIENETMNNRISNDERRVTNQGILSILFLKKQSEVTSTNPKSKITPKM